MKNKDTTKERILNKIHNKEIQMQPRWRFEVKNQITRSGLILGILAGCLGFGGLIYWWKIKNMGEIWEYGSVGTEVMLKIFPYWLVVAVVVALGIAIFLFRKIGTNYRKPLETTALAIAIMTIVGAIMIIWFQDWWELELWLRL